MAIPKIVDTTILKDWIPIINDLIDSNSQKLEKTANAVSSSKLQTARKINGTSFDGTSDITTNSWGTARSFTISDGTNKGTSTSVNGSTDYTLNLPININALCSKATSDSDGNKISTTYLKLSGGTMTGDVIFNKTDAVLRKYDKTGRLVLRGGSSAFEDGASLYLHGNSRTDLPGVFQVYAHDGTNQSYLQGKPDGTLTWASKNIVRSVNSVTADTTGNVNMLDKIYPVGSIYMSVNSTNPSSLFGGTWEQIQGRFLLASSSSYTAGSTGGEATHTLSASEIPSHTHTASTDSQGAHTHTRGTMEIYGKVDCPCGSDDGPLATTGTGYGAFSVWANGNNGADGNSASDGGGAASFDFYASRNWTGATSSNGAHTHTVSIGSTGSGTAHNNMPPYLAVYVWKRTK